MNSETDQKERLPMDQIRKNQVLWKKIGIIAGVYLGMKYLVPLLVPFFCCGPSGMLVLAMA